MARITVSTKACSVNPLKMSQPIGGALAFLGLDKSMPILHGSQGCTSFGLVLFVRHFREAIPLQTTAMSEVATILGGLENIEKAILNIYNRAKPEIIGICSTGVTETKGDDVDGQIKLFRQAHPELDDVSIVYVSTPDFKDAFQDGWARTVTRVIDTIVLPVAAARPEQVNVLCGCHLSPGDIDELRDIIESFGLQPLFVPDLSGSLDGHMPDTWTPTTIGGTPRDAIRGMGGAAATLVIGEQMRAAGVALAQRTGQTLHHFDRLTGLAANDRLMTVLSSLSGRPVPKKWRRQRSQLQDAMLDGHFSIGGKRIALGAEPDLLHAMAHFVTEMGAEVVAAVTTTHSPTLEHMPCDEVVIGDLEDLETRAAARGCDLLITHSHGRQMAERLSLPFLRLGIPTFDRLGAGHVVTVGYRGTRDLIFTLGNLFMANLHEVDPSTWAGADRWHPWLDAQERDEVARALAPRDGEEPMNDLTDPQMTDASA